MQDKQSAEELGVRLQTLAKKFSLVVIQKSWFLKGQYYQAWLSKCQCKLGAPKSTETFDDLYARACALERHDQQFNAKASSNKPPNSSQELQTTTKQTGLEQNQESNSSRSQKHSAGQNKPRGKRCWHCYEYRYFEKDRPKLGPEFPGKSTRSKISTLATSGVQEMSIQQLVEVLASKRLAAEEKKNSL